MRVPEAVGLLRETYTEWSADNASTIAAALAYFTAFAMAPLIIIVIEIGAALLGGNGHHHVVRNEILRDLQPSIGASGTKAVGDLVDATFSQRRHGAIAAIISWVVFFAAATGLFASVQSALDTVWHVKNTGGFLATVIDRAKSVLIIAALSVVLVLSFAANAGLSALSGTLAAAIPGWHYAVIAGEALISFVVVSAAFAAIYKFLPRTSIDWNDVLIGACITGALFMAGQYVIGIYLGRVSTTSTYGAAGSFVALLIWLYYSGQIFLFGAEFTKVYAGKYGSKSGASAPAVKGMVTRTATETPRASA